KCKVHGGEKKGITCLRTRMHYSGDCFDFECYKISRLS
ncbi:unnamed protein product, partial [marine sediment metagenome]